MGTYHLTKSKNEQYHWTLKAGNGEPILSSEMYTTKGAAFGGISSCKENSADADQYVKLTSKSDQPYFVLRAKNNETIGTSEMYSSTQARDGGVDSCIAYGPTAATKDDSG